MVAPRRLKPTKHYLRDKWIFVPTLDPAGISLATLTGASALDVTLMFFASSARPTQATNIVRQPKYIGDAETYEQVGETNPSFGEIRYGYDPQAAAGSPENAVFETFPAFATGWLVNRLGIDRMVELKQTDFVTPYPVEFGPQHEVPEGEGESALTAIVQSVAQTGPKLLRRQLVA